MEESKSGKLKLENTYIRLPEMFYSKQNPDKAEEPELKVFNNSLAEKFNLDSEYLKSREGIDVLCGNSVLPGTIPIAQAYAGHQFGHFTMLGDGRAVLLGEIEDKDSRKYDLQLKGSGITPYSRGGDGKAALGPMLREYIISEAMYGLGIETTRSLAVIKTGEKVYREKVLDGAVLARISASHIRVGTFEYAMNFGTLDDIKELADYTIERHFKDCKSENESKEENEEIEKQYEENPYLYMLNCLIKNHANLIAKWQLVGFIHGVMNTDNASISGETIDYGPCAFMDTYDPDTVFSSIDTYGRYAYKNQPKIAVWNLARFAETLVPLIDDDSDKAVKIAEEALHGFMPIFEKAYYNGMRKKLGLFNAEEDDINLIDELLDIMKEEKADYTNTFYYMTCSTFNEERMQLFKSSKFKEWHKKWEARLKKQDQTQDDVTKLMESNNPAVIPRNHKVEEALKEATENDDYTMFENLVEAVKRPYDYSNINKEFLDVPQTTSKCYKTYCGT